MNKVVTVEEMLAIEKAADDSGEIDYAQMMQNAGRAVADVIKGLLTPLDGPGRVAILVGPGNNGGDGLVTARILAEETEAEVGAYLLRPREDDLFEAAQGAGVFLADAENDQRWRILRTMVGNADVLVDALLGTGTELPLRDEASKLLKQAAGAAEISPEPPTLVRPTAPDAPSPPPVTVVAVDCASGLDCDTGEVDSATIPADVTVTFAAAKRGHLLMPGGAYTGDLIIADIGISDRLEPLRDVTVEVSTAAMVRGVLPERPADSHKGTYGRVLVTAGSINYVGAASLAGQAAYRAGAGLVTMAVPQPIYPMLAAAIPEAVWLLLPNEMGALNEAAFEVLRKEAGRIDAMLVGPGLGQEDATGDFLRVLLKGGERKAKRGPMGFTAAQNTEPKEDDTPFSLPERLVIDADGLNLLAGIDTWWQALPAQTVITPHPGEMARLTEMSTEDVQADRIGVAQAKATEWGCVVLLKGAYSVVATPGGKTTVLPFATDALATAGTGDVLAGCIVGLMGQGATAENAAIAAAYIHGVAGQNAAAALGSGRAVLAGDVLAHLPGAFAALEG